MGVPIRMTSRPEAPINFWSTLHLDSMSAHWSILGCPFRPVRTTTLAGTYKIRAPSSPNVTYCYHHPFPQTSRPGQQASKRFLRLEPERIMASSPPFNKLVYYTAGTPNGHKPALLLEELGLKYEVVAIDIMKNTQKVQTKRPSTFW